MPGLNDWFDEAGDYLPKAREVFVAAQEDERFFRELSEWGATLRREDVSLLAPVPRPGKLICVGLNYRDHAVESKMPIPASPVIFSKFTTSVVGPHKPVVIPPTSAKVDYEAELAVHRAPR